MKIYPSDKIRNVAVVAHQGAGKTSLVEAMVYATGATSRLGKVDDGNTVSDYFPEEIKRKLTVNTSLVSCEWKDHKINLLDTPGFTDFFGEVEGSLRVADSLLMVLDLSLIHIFWSAFLCPLITLVVCPAPFRLAGI